MSAASFVRALFAAAACAASTLTGIAAAPVLPSPVPAVQSLFPEDQVTRITCGYSGKTYHYDLYIPQGYYASAGAYPTIFIASPGGNATMGNSAGWIHDHRWLAVMLVEAKNGQLSTRASRRGRIRASALVWFAKAYVGASWIGRRLTRTGDRG